MEKQPYVISAELDLGTNDTSTYIKRNRLEEFRESLDADLRKMGKETIWIASSDITTSLNRATQKTQLPIVSLDDRYVSNADQYLGISRCINSDLSDAGYASRQNYAPLTKQLEQIPTLGREIMLADDVLYSGEMISWLCEDLARSGVTIRSVAVGVAMQEGIDKLIDQGIDVMAGRVFASVDDELCERDFATVNGSGRRVADLEANALYFDTDNGKPEQWASITSGNTKAFCIASLERSLRLLRPETSIRSIGNFLGYSSEGDVTTALQSRLGELS